MLYSLSTYNSSKLGYLIYSWDYYDKIETKCKTCGRVKTDISIKYWPPKFALEGGAEYPDLLSFVTPFADKCGVILSEKALKAFQSAEISGFHTNLIEVLDNPKNLKKEFPPHMPIYYYCCVTGNIALDYTTMHYRKKNMCPECGQYTWSRQRIGESALDLSTWDQSDLCKLTDYPNVYICTQRVVDVVKQNNLKGFSIASEKDIFLPLKHKKIC